MLASHTAYKRIEKANLMAFSQKLLLIHFLLLYTENEFV